MFGNALNRGQPVRFGDGLCGSGVAGKKGKGESRGVKDVHLRLTTVFVLGEGEGHA